MQLVKPLCCSLLMSLLWHQAFAQDSAAIPGERITPAFADMDTNGDGLLASGELPLNHALAPLFRSFDANRDGSLTVAEFDAWRVGTPDEFGTLDRDGDGLIRDSELPLGHALVDQFVSFDLNGDDFLSRAEYDAFEARNR